MFEVVLADDWDKYYSKMDQSEKEKIWKKILQLQTLQTARHLGHGESFFVVEAGQYRICFREKEKTRTIIFAGNHSQRLRNQAVDGAFLKRCDKQYEKWYKK